MQESMGFGEGIRRGLIVFIGKNRKDLLGWSVEILRQIVLVFFLEVFKGFFEVFEYYINKMDYSDGRLEVKRLVRNLGQLYKKEIKVFEYRKEKL